MAVRNVTSQGYDMRRVDKVNLAIIWVLIAIIVEQAFLKSTDRGFTVLPQALIVGAVATTIFFLPIPRFAKSLLFGLVPALAICAVTYLGQFSLDRHYMLCITTAIIALYFNRKLLIVYGAILNTVIIAMYILVPEKLLGDQASIPYFLSIFFMLNGQVIVLFFLTKWGSEILAKAVSNEKAQAELNNKLTIASQLNEKQAQYQQVHVDRLLAGLRKIAGGNLSCGITIDSGDEDTAQNRRIFEAINESLTHSANAIGRMARDVSALATAALEGRLDARADVAGYQGEYRQIVEGMNSALDAIQKPIGEASGMMARIAEGSLDCVVDRQYSGDYAVLIRNVNGTADGLKTIIGEIATVLAEIANGNLDVNLNAEYRGDFSAIRDSLAASMQAFNEVLQQMQDAANQVASGTVQVSGGAQTLSQGATEQASAIEQLTVSMEQIANQTRQNALDAGKASNLTAEAREHALNGNERMGEMLKSMQEINDASASISTIIKVIDEIAFQTNLLALNAAVEAARAGQYGKGFAVVAEEVRSLAQRSAGAAKETSALIESTVAKTGAGMRTAQETAQALSGIVGSVEKASELVAGIAAASNEQATAVSQVSRGIEQVAQVVQSTSATAEESAATSEELSGQAEYLKQMVGRFRLRGGNQTIAQAHRQEISQTTSYGLRSRAQICLGDREIGKY